MNDTVDASSKYQDSLPISSDAMRRRFFLQSPLGGGGGAPFS